MRTTNPIYTLAAITLLWGLTGCAASPPPTPPTETATPSPSPLTATPSPTEIPATATPTASATVEPSPTVDKPCLDSRIVFRGKGDADTYPGGLYTICSDGSGLKRIADWNHDYRLSQNSANGLIAIADNSVSPTIIRILDSDGEVVDALLEDGNVGAIFELAWSLDGRYLFFDTNRRTMEMVHVASDVTSVFLTIRDLAEGEGALWADENTVVLYALPPPLRAIRSISVNCSEIEHTCTVDEMGEFIHIDRPFEAYPALSPDGSRLAAGCMDQQDLERRDICIWDTAGNLLEEFDLSQCPLYRAMFPAWSPDGTRIVFSAGDPDYYSRLFILDVESGEVTALTPGYLYAYQSIWLP